MNSPKSVRGNLALVTSNDDSKPKRARRERTPPLTKEQALKSISGDLGGLREASQALSKLLENLTRSVSGNVDVNLSLKDDAKKVLETIDECEESAKRILAVVIARCKARIDE